MDFVENVGQTYLQRKAHQAPQQLENFAVEQFTGGDKDAMTEAAGKGGAHTVDASISKFPPAAGASGKDAEIARLREELATYKLDQSKDKASSAASKERAQAERGAAKPTSAASKIKALDGRVEKGKISTKPKNTIHNENKGSKKINPIIGLEALDGRVEKGKISTRKPRKALAEAKGSPGGQRKRSVGAYTSTPSRPQSRNKSTSTAASSEVGVGRGRRGSSAAPIHQAPRSRTPTGIPPQSNRSVYDHSPSSSSPYYVSVDAESEHGGSTALLHARDRHRRRSSVGAAPEIPPSERRPEVVGAGFRPHRSPPRPRRRCREVGIVEVTEEPVRRVPRVKETHRELRAAVAERVVDVRREGFGRTFYTVR